MCDPGLEKKKKKKKDTKVTNYYYKEKIQARDQLNQIFKKKNL